MVTFQSVKNFLQQKLEINWTSDEIGKMFSLNPQKWKRDNAMQCNMVDYSGMNILHLAICFHPRSVCSLLRVLQDHNLTEHLINEQVCQLLPNSSFHRFLYSNSNSWFTAKLPRDLWIFRQLTQRRPPCTWQSVVKQLELSNFSWSMELTHLYSTTGMKAP